MIWLSRTRHIRLLYMQFKQERRMAVDLLRAGYSANDITRLIKRLRKYA